MIRAREPDALRLGGDIVASQLGDRAGILGGAYPAIEHRLRPERLDDELDRRVSSGELTAWA